MPSYRLCLADHRLFLRSAYNAEHICVLSLSGVYFKLVKDYKARYMGIGKIDPDFKPFFEDEVKK